MPSKTFVAGEKSMPDFKASKGQNDFPGSR